MRDSLVGPRCFLIVLLALLFAVPATAQTGGTINGTIRDAQGGVLPGVTVEAKSPNLQGTRSAVTDSDGRFNLTLLPPGPYTVTATLAGFAPKVQTLQLSLAQAAVLRIEIIQAQAEEVTVTAQAATVETESNTVGRTMDQKAFQALPTGSAFSCDPSPLTTR